MSKRAEQLTAHLQERFAGKVRHVPSTCDEVTFEVEAEQLLEVATALRDEEEFRFEVLIDVCGVDYLDYGRSEWETYDSTDTGYSRGVQRAGAAQRPQRGRLQQGQPRFAAVYHLLSIAHNSRLRLRAFCADDDAPVLDSVTPVWPAANWFEREAFDLFGIMFRDHPDLRRILTDYGFIGHPFRKDFPLIGNVEVRYDPEKGRVVYQPVSIEPRTLVPKVIRRDNRYMSESTEGMPGDE